MRIRLFNPSRWPLFVLGALVALYVVYFAWYTFATVDRYQTGGFDLAVYDQAVWNTSHGRWFRSTYEPGWDILLADHFEPILLPFALLYRLWPSAKALLLVQIVAVGLGALPVYWLGYDRLRAAMGGGSPAPLGRARPNGLTPEAPLQIASLAFAIGYLLYPPLQSAVTYEFHPSVLAVPFLLYALYFLRHKRRLLFAVFVILAMSTKETMPLTTLAVGLYALIVCREWALGLSTSVVSAAWFALAVFVIIPHFSPSQKSMYLAQEYYSWLGASSSEIITRLVTHPGLIVERLFSQISPGYFVGILGPMAFVSFFGLPVLLLAVPTLALNALSDVSLQYSLGSYFHYAAPLAPFVIVAAIDGVAFLMQQVGRLGRPARVGPGGLRWAVLALVTTLILAASLVAHVRQGYLPFGGRFYLLPVSDQVTAVDALVAQVPAEASLSTDRHPAPHLSHRTDLLLYPDEPDADFQLIDVGYPDWMYPPRDRYETIQDLLGSAQYGVRDGRSRYLLLERGLNQPTIPDSFYTFVRAVDPSPQYRLEVDWGEELRLVGFDFRWERPFFPRAHIVLYWQARRPVDRDLRLFAIQTDLSGEPRPATELEFVESVWLPPSRWPPSQVMRLETFHWYTLEPEQFGVAVGVVEGPGFWDVDKRLRPAIHSAPWDMPLVHGDTLLWLGTVSVADQVATLLPPAGAVPR